MLEDGATATTSALRVDGDGRAATRLELDFAGTDPQVEGNLNCPLSVTKSAALLRRPRR